ncbi:MAG: SurA N-terminal domain-containing protein [Thermodesulfovibrionales bacterium]
MLKALRQHARYFYFLFVIVIITFIFWGIGTKDDRSVVIVAEVEGYKITSEEYWRSYENVRNNYRQLFQENFTEEIEKGLKLKEMVLNNLIDQKASLVIADQLKITVSDKEVQDAIIRDPRFARDGIFRKDIYLRTLELNRIRPEQYENSLRQQIILMKVGRFLEESVGSIDDANNKDKQSEMAMKMMLIQSFVEQSKQRMKIKINRDMIS